MATLFEAANGTTTLLPGTSWAAPNGLFGAEDRNDSSAYSWTDSTSTITLPSSGLADGYLFCWGFEFEDTSNGRHNPQGRMQQASGTGNFVTSTTAGYNRDNSEDRAYVAGWSFVDGPSASSTFQFEWKRDADTPTGGTVRSFIQAIPFYYSDIGLYTSTTAALYGGTTPNLMTGFSGTDGTNITISSNQVSVTGDNKRYLTLGAGFMEGHGGTRTQRWYGLEIDGTFDHAAKGCMYLRNASNDEGGESFIRLLETDTATRTIEMNCYRGDGVGAGQGGADVDGSTPTVAAHALVVIELNDDAEVYSSVDSVGGQEFALTGPVDVDIASTGDIEFNDAASFTRSTDTGVNIEQNMDVFAFANVSHARESGSIGSGSRWTVHGEFTVNGTEQTGVGFHGNYNRGNQGSADCHGSSCNQAAFFAVTSGQDIGVSNQELAGTEGGAGDIETQAGWVGFGLINLDTLEAAGSDTTINATHDSLTLTTYPVTLQPNVYLNTSETLTGATEMTVTSYNLAGTSITFDDPAGAPTGSVSLGVQNMANGAVGWISVTVNTGDTTINATHDALTLTEYAVSTAFDVSIDATHDSLVLTEYGTSISLDVTISATHDALALTEYQVSTTFDVQIDATHDALALTEYATSIAVDVDINATHDALVLTTYPVSLSADTVISATHDALALTEYATSIVVDVEINATHDALTLTTYQVSLSADTVIEATHDTLSLTEYPVSTVYDVAINATHDALTLTTYPVSLGQDVNITATHHALSLTQYQITAQYDVTINATHNALAITEYAVTQQFDVTIAAEHDALVLTTYPTTIVAGLDTLIEATHHALTLTEYVASVIGVQLGQADQPTGGISKRRRRRFLIEIDGQFFDADSVQAVQAHLEMVRELAEQSAEQDAITHVDKPIRIKPPRIRVTTSDRKPVESITIKRDLEKTQRIVNDIYKKTADNVRDIRLLASKRAERIRRDEEEAIISLLL